MKDIVWIPWKCLKTFVAGLALRSQQVIITRVTASVVVRALNCSLAKHLLSKYRPTHTYTVHAYKNHFMSIVAGIWLLDEKLR